MLRIYACISHDCRQTIEMLIMVVWRFFCRVACCRCRPRRSPVAGGTRLHPRQLLLDLGNLLLEGSHVFGRRFLVFEDVVVFGIVVFGGLSFVVGFFMRGLSLDFRVSGVAMRTPAPFFVPVEGIGEGFPKRDFGRNSEGTLSNVFQNRRSPKWLVWGSVPKLTWRKGSISQ